MDGNGDGSHPSVGRRSAPLVASLVADADALRLKLERTGSGALIIDAGIEAPGGIEAGRRIAEICMGGIGWVELADGRSEGWPFRVGSGRPSQCSPAWPRNMPAGA